jgi:hypothetical protein
MTLSTAARTSRATQLNTRIQFGDGLRVPVVFFATGRVWFRMVGGSTPRVDKAWATACLLLPLAGLVMIVKVGFETIGRAVFGLTPPVVRKGLNFEPVLCGLSPPVLGGGPLVRIYTLCTTGVT